MKLFISSVVFVFTILNVTTSFAQNPLPAQSNIAQPSSTAGDTVDVQHVIDAYHEAVLTNDGSRLARLFLSQGGMWLNVLSDEAYARAKAKSPDAVKVRVGSYTDFAKLVSTSKASFNPTHTHLQENSDGTIASVYFDFVFLVDGKNKIAGAKRGCWLKEPRAGG